MKVQPATLGPITGHTTPYTAKLWMRLDPTVHDRITAVARVGGPGGKVLLQDVEPNVDGICVIDLENLGISRSYVVHVGWVNARLRDVTTALDLLDWQGASEGSVRTAAQSPTKERTYAIGSCRYPELKAEDERDADRIFEAILKKRPDRVVLCGDQIYADPMVELPGMPSGYSAVTDLQGYLGRWYDAFRQTHIRRLLAHTPVSMMHDDHEVQNNFPMGTDPARIEPAQYCGGLYMFSHSSAAYNRAGPGARLRPAGWVGGEPNRWWYSLSDGCVDTFVLDVRSWRGLHGDHRLLGRPQFEELRAWLIDADRANKVKVIVSSVPVFPDMGGSVEDRWSGFPDERRAVLDLIRDNKVHKVVFASGDIHCSLSAELDLGEGVRVHQIISSPLHFKWEPALEVYHRFSNVFSPRLAGYEHGPLSDSTAIVADNFALATFKPSGFKVEFLDLNGNEFPLGARTYGFSG